MRDTPSLTLHDHSMYEASWCHALNAVEYNRVVIDASITFVVIQLCLLFNNLIIDIRFVLFCTDVFLIFFLCKTLDTQGLKATSRCGLKFLFKRTLSPTPRAETGLHSLQSIQIGLGIFEIIALSRILKYRI